MSENLQDLDVIKMLSGDGPSLRAIGIYAAESLKKTGVAVFMADVLGRVHIMPPTCVSLPRPRVLEEELDRMDDDRAIEVMVAQGDEDGVITEYLSARKERIRV